MLDGESFHSWQCLLSFQLLDHSIGQIGCMNEVSRLYESHSVDPRSRIQLQDAAPGNKEPVNVLIDLFTQILKHNIALIIVIIVCCLFAEGLVDGIRIASVHGSVFQA